MPAGSRLFALTATEEGQIELVHLRDGGPVPVRRFRVDLAPRPTGPGPTPARSAGAHEPWSGDVEPVPFPFRFGLTTRVADVAIDAGGERLLAATVNGFLHAWTLADGAVEVLPRGEYDGAVLTVVQAVVGVGNGFAVCGRWGAGLAVVHYDWSTRKATLHRLVMDAGSLEAAWYGFPHLHSVVLRAGPTYRAVDLGTGAVYPGTKHGPEVVSRAQAAVWNTRQLLLPPPMVPVVNADHGQTHQPPYLVHESATGRLRLFLPGRDCWFQPMIDGRPRYRTFAPVAQLAGPTLALFATQPQTWTLFNMEEADDWRSVVEYPPATFGVAKLSLDGRLFVRQTASGELAVTEPATQKRVLTTRPGRCHSNLEVRLGPTCLGMSVGPHGCLIDWTEAPLIVYDGRTAADDFGGRTRTRFQTSRTSPDFGRFQSHFRYPKWSVAVDCFGQVVFLRESRAVCMFIFRRGKLAAWTPDGVRWGPAELTGGPETPGALERLGETLRHLTG